MTGTGKNSKCPPATYPLGTGGGGGSRGMTLPILNLGGRGCFNATAWLLYFRLGYLVRVMLNAEWTLTAGLNRCGVEENCHLSGFKPREFPSLQQHSCLTSFLVSSFCPANCTNLAGYEKVVKNSLRRGQWGTKELLPSRSERRNYKGRAGNPGCKVIKRHRWWNFKFRLQISGYSVYSSNSLLAVIKSYYGNHSLKNNKQINSLRHRRLRWSSC